jgi:hypothetical protein
MLTNPTIETLKSLKLHGMMEALEEQQQTPAIQALSFEERIALIVDPKRLYRDNQRRTRLLRGAHLKVAEASIEDINYKAARGLDKRQIATLATGEWIRRSQNLLITGRHRRPVKPGSLARSRSRPVARALGAVLARATPHRGAARLARRWQLHQVPQDDLQGLSDRPG